MDKSQPTNSPSISPDATGLPSRAPAQADAYLMRKKYFHEKLLNALLIGVMGPIVVFASCVFSIFAPDRGIKGERIDPKTTIISRIMGLGGGAMVAGSFYSEPVKELTLGLWAAATAGFAAVALNNEFSRDTEVPDHHAMHLRLRQNRQLEAEQTEPTPSVRHQDKLLHERAETASTAQIR